MKRSGFTLTELIISIGLALLLIIGVNQVFRAASDTIGTGHALSTVNRNAQIAHRILSSDVQSTARDAPFLAIRNGVTTSYLTAGDADEGITADRRTDTFITFARGEFHRQTGNDGKIVAEGDEREAYIWIGHLNTDGHAPGSGNPTTNRTNYYANDWMLGRMVMLMSPAPEGIVYEQDTEDELYSFGYDPAYAGVPNLTPFVADAVSSDGTSRLPDSRYDAAALSIDTYRWVIEHAAKTTADWWRPLLDFRFQTTSSVSRPLSAKVAAKLVPQFIPNSPEFIVEFAGDWVTQNQTTGDIVGYEPDGVIDFRLSGPDKTIQWFGLPRDVDGDGTNDVLPMYWFANSAAPFERNLTATEYVCVWGGDYRGPIPTYIRFVITMTDGRQRLAEGMKIEVVSRPR